MDIGRGGGIGGPAWGDEGGWIGIGGGFVGGGPVFGIGGGITW